MLAFACAGAQAADGIEITRASIEASDDGYRLSVNYAFELPYGLQQAVQHGTPLYFTTEIELTRPRWYWTDDRAISSKRTVRLYYDVLTRVYHVSAPGSVQQTFDTLDEALFLIRRPGRWLIGAKGTLKPGETYNVSLRMFMDREYLQKPLQVDAFNNSDWRLTSHKKTFTYRAE
ncbi:DUF4390 domain-containing protein [Massilia sp. YIM B02763]|uniref:DUF4390 domain-containing protein n=1 Tax=Massilia sp. YIM B02763 TaxID=3050130 RepID=UPI0025B6BC72|nr:DUF4390 domain-containing protein [Massilia sp. YIM B02763]MDN4055831.1 DUF4390 domain-containing protein [Massilia sp. YIM B02763]